MRLIFMAIALTWAAGALAQTQAANTSVQMPTAAARSPLAGQPSRRSSPFGTVPGRPKKAEVSPETAIVTVDGLCRDGVTKGSCKAVITREDLDRFVSVFAPNASDAARSSLAVRYAGMVVFSTIAEQQGLGADSTAGKEVAVKAKLLHMRDLANAFLQHVEKQIPSIPEGDVQKYYDEHRKEYEQVRAWRVALPDAAPTESGRSLKASDIRSEMDKLRAGAAAGGDLNQLKQTAFHDLHILATPPPVPLVTLQRGTAQGDEAKVFDLNPGELSSVLDLAAAFVVFKMDSKDATPLESLRPEIEAALREERTQEKVRNLAKNVSAQFNLQYLGMTSQPDIFVLTSFNPPMGGSLRHSSQMRGASTEAAQSKAR